MIRKPLTSVHFTIQRRTHLASSSAYTATALKNLQVSSPKRQCQRASYARAATALAHSGSSSSRVASTSYSSGNSGVPPPENEPRRSNDDGEYVSDREWELRTGHAIDVLTQTLPNFFTSGLVATGTSSLANALHLPGVIQNRLHGLLDVKGKGKERAEDDINTSNNAEHASENHHGEGDERGIYGKNISLEYTFPEVPTSLLPRRINVEGLVLYVGSSVLLRHSMLALYTDLSVDLRKITIKDSSNSRSISDADSLSPPSELITRPGEGSAKRQKAVTLSMLVSGKGRLGLSTERAEWDVVCTYTFSPITGLIIRHTVNEIHPAPHESVYAALRLTLRKLALSGERTEGVGKGAVNFSMGQKRS